LFILSQCNRARNRPHSEDGPPFAERIAIMERLVEDYPTFADYRWLLARDLYVQGQSIARGRDSVRAVPILERALATFDALVAEFPDNAGYQLFQNNCRYWCAATQRNVGRESESLELLTRIPESHKTNSQAKWQRARIRLTARDPKLRDPAEALRMTTWAIGIPDGGLPFHQLADWQFLHALAQYRAGDYAGAKGNLDALKSAPGFEIAIKYVRALALWRLGERERAHAEARSAMEQRQRDGTDALLDVLHPEAVAELGLKEPDSVKPEPMN
jgi:tetratricopeptide (TPR) repeat protein